MHVYSVWTQRLLLVWVDSLRIMVPARVSCSSLDRRLIITISVGNTPLVAFCSKVQLILNNLQLQQPIAATELLTPPGVCYSDFCDVSVYCPAKIKSVRKLPGFEYLHMAAVAEWYAYRIVACLVTSSSPVPLKTHRVGQRCTLNLSRAETFRVGVVW
ncbi:hypothetical protein TNCV_3659751 [Trichonephila clavipes]|nr:hypothetical protein TNCV_3659751 [Trichonephila clavipes]